MRHPFTTYLLAGVLALSGEAGRAEPALDRAVGPAAVMDEIGTLVRREFFDPDGLKAFDAAEPRFRELAASGRLDEAAEQWLATLDSTHTGRFTPDGIDYYELSEVFHRGIRDRHELFPPRGIVTYPGIGMVAREIEGKLFVADVYDGSPAAESGVRVGDEVLAVDGRPYEPIGSFRDKVGRTVTLDLRRDAGAPPISVPTPVERLQPRDMFLEAIRKSSRLIEVDGRQVAYLRIWAFAVSGVEDLIAELLTSEPLARAEGLILDMRGRWGGAPADAADMFVGRSGHMTVTERDGDEHVVNMRWQKPVVGIIDEGSRSGMEILAYGLKKAGVPLVGTKTAGAVVAGRAFRLRDNSLLEVAVLDVHVDGRRLEGAGVAPDVEVPFDLRYAAGADPQLDRAVTEMSAILRR